MLAVPRQFRHEPRRLMPKLDRVPDMRIAVAVPNQHLPRLDLRMAKTFGEVEHGGEADVPALEPCLPLGARPRAERLRQKGFDRRMSGAWRLRCDRDEILAVERCQ